MAGMRAKTAEGEEAEWRQFVWTKNMREQLPNVSFCSRFVVVFFPLPF
jgi:hypothetical protein